MERMRDEEIDRIVSTSRYGGATDLFMEIFPIPSPPAPSSATTIVAGWSDTPCREEMVRERHALPSSVASAEGAGMGWS